MIVTFDLSTFQKMKVVSPRKTVMWKLWRHSLLCLLSLEQQSHFPLSRKILSVTVLKFLKKSYS